VTEIAIHAWLVPDHLHAMPYMGALFVVACVLLAAVLGGLVLAPRNEAVWAAGAVICAGMVVGFLASRTVGLPSYHEAWTSDSSLGLWSLPPDVVFVLVAVRVLGTARAAAGQPTADSPAAVGVG
jgi:hypothetical protein